MAELRLSEKSAGDLQDFTSPAQFLDLSLQRPDAFPFVIADPVAHAAIDVVTLGPIQERLRCADDHRCNGCNCCPDRRMFTTLLAPRLTRALGLPGKTC